MTQPTYLLTVTLPVTDNGGAEVAEAHTQLRNLLLAIAGGYSMTFANGAWKDGGVVYRDSNQVYSVACTALQAKQIQSAIPSICALARQQCVYVTRQRISVSFLEPANVAGSQSGKTA